MGTAREGRHSRQKERSEQRSGVGWEVVWTVGRGGRAGRQASATRGGKRQEEAGCGVC